MGICLLLHRSLKLKNYNFFMEITTERDGTCNKNAVKLYKFTLMSAFMVNEPLTLVAFKRGI